MTEAREASAELDATQAKLTAAWDVRGIDIDRVAFRGETIVAPSSRFVDRVQRVQTLPALLAPGGEGTLPPYKLGQMLAKGGMGVIHAAEQTALEREVAIKGLHEDADPVQSAPQLLREARVTGALEHPNVVPVYALGRDEHGRPMMVMKRIEGTAWCDLLADAEPAQRANVGYLHEHLGILVQVAKAVHFAHQKGIIHRDIKPENVMIGRFGEVYVVDWGIAVSLREGRLKGVPTAKEVTSIEGTPAYMAPEMAAGDGDAIDEQTDVYLLGATLHHVLAGSPPHDAPTLLMVLTHAFASERHSYAPTVPPELVAICHRAMARFNEDRYSSARDFANAVGEFLEHHGSIVLAEVAHKRLERLRSLAKHDASSDRSTIATLFTECRFAFKQALRDWGGNHAARAGLEQTLELMVELELSRGAVETAAGLLHELNDPPERLRQQIASILGLKRRAEERLAVLERDRDVTFGARVRNILTYIMASLWGMACILCGVGSRGGWLEVDHIGFAVVNVLFMAASAALVALTKDTMLANATNRRITFLTITVFAGQAMMWPLLGALELNMPESNLVACLCTALVWFTATYGVDTRWLSLPALRVVAIAGIWLWPRYHFEILGVTGLIGSLGTASQRWNECAPEASGTSDARD